MAIIVAAQVAWEVPPEPVRQATGGAQVSQEWLDVAQLLTDNPLQWAKVAEAEKQAQASALAHRINKGLTKAFEPAGSFEAQSRPSGNGGGYVWARFVGDDVDPAKVLADGNELASLKEMAKDRRLTTSGTKKDIAARIIEHDQGQPELEYAAQ
jgi:hypothetical protein